jgi:putative colanic acid biosynthesis acetyltransferase WcaF
MNHPDTKPRPLVDSEPWTDLRLYDQSSFARGRAGGFILFWWLVQALLFPLSLHNAHGFRSWLLQLFGAKIGRGVKIRPTARFTYPWKVEIGDYSWIGDDVVVYSLDTIKIGSQCVISQKTYLCTGSHDPCDRTFALKTAPITIGNGVWVAADCFISPGVTIGSNAVIGTRSTVFTDIPEAQVAFGTPCRPQYRRSMN